MVTICVPLRLLIAFLVLLLVVSTPGAVPAQGQTLPGAPTIGTVTGAHKSLTVTWTAPADTGSAAISAYDLRWIDADATDRSDSAWTVLDDFWTSGDLTGQVTNLSNGAEYDLQMRAVTSVGNGPWSTKTSATPQITAPTVTAVTPSEESITVAWTPTDQATSDDTVDYDVRWISSSATDKSDSEWTVASRVGAAPTHHIIGELTNGTGYDVQVRTVINEEEGTWSATKEATPYEPAGSPSSTQTAIELDVPVAAEISTSDTDVFRLVLQESTRLLIRTTSDSIDSKCSLIDADSNTINNGAIKGDNDDGILPGSSEDQEQCVIAITPPGTFPATFYVKVESDDDTGPYVLHVEAPPDPGNSIATAAPIALGEVKTGGHSADDDADYVQLVLDQSTYAVLTIYYPTPPVRPRVKIEDSKGNTLGAAVEDYEICPFDCIDVGTRIHILPASGDRYVKIEPPEDMEDPRSADYYFALSVDTEYVALLEGCRAESRPEGIADELAGCQWHLENRGQLGGTSGEDANVAAAHQAGYLGEGVQVAVVDDGIDYNHPDLSDNASAARSHSYCPHDSSPFSEIGHGTAVAGLLAARDNSQGVRGVAPRAQLHNFRLLGCSDVVSDANAAAAMIRNKATVAVSNNSWSLGLSLSPLSMPTAWETAVQDGVTSGFGGKGVSYVWSAGNDDTFGGYSNLDEATNHYAVIPVCAVNGAGQRSAYSEKGPNLWVCAPSHDNNPTMPALTTTATHGRYQTDFGGTSGAAPIVSGVVALMRAANSNLTWRDVKLVLAGSARRSDTDDDGWAEGALKYGSDTDRYWFNHQYGFGVVDALAAVQLGIGWNNVPTLLSETKSSTGVDLDIPDDGTAATTSVTLTDAIEFIEHVEINTTFDADEFRSLKVELVSPSGTTSLLSPSHSRCCELDGSFRFGSSAHLGEPAKGAWTLKITDEHTGGDAAELTDWGVTLRGHRLRPTAPAAPTVSTGAGTLTITWTAPDRTGASAINGYDIRYILAGATDRSDLAWRKANDIWSSGSLTHTLNGLSARAWDVQVRAKNAEATGPWSSETEATPTAGGNAEPFFSPTAVTRSVAENTAAATSIGSPVAAIDHSTSSTLTYSLGGTDAAHFTIDTSSGQLKTKSSLNHEDKETYSVTVSVHDGLNSSGSSDTSVDDTVEVTINVTDVNEPPIITDDCTFTVAENTSTVWECAFVASDPEMTTIQWSLSGPDAASFSLTADNTDGELQTRSDLQIDYETTTTYSATLQLTDGDGLSTNHDITLNVSNVDEPGSVQVLRADQAGVGTQMEATLSDPDGPSGQTWQWQRRSGSWEDIPTATSRFYTPTSDDQGLMLRVKVSYTDSTFGAETLTSTATSTVAPPPNVAPAFGQEQYTCQVNENRPTGALPDCAPPATDGNDDPIMYRLDGGTPFTVNAQTGQLSLDGPLDHETRHQHQFDIIASDGLLEGRATITIQVVDIDEPGTATIEFDTPLQPGATLEASVSDQDCPQTGCQASWEWQRSSNGVEWDTIATEANYTLVGADQCHQVRVQATYTDSHGAQQALGTPGAAGEVVQRLTGSCNPPPSTGGGGEGGGQARPEEEEPRQPIEFADVNPSNPHAPNIQALAAAGITAGCTTQPPHYCPNQPVTRAQMATFLTRALNLPTQNPTHRFADVNPSNPHAPNIQALAAADITAGCTTQPPHYRPNQPVTRAQMATFLTRALNLPTQNPTHRFADVNPSNPHAPNIQALAAAGITVGCTTQPPHYRPNQPVTRAQMATFLIRALNLLKAELTQSP